MRPGEFGEFTLIEKVKKQLASNCHGIIQAVGDDAAVFDWSDTSAGVLTIDCLVENIHFDLTYTSFESLGWKSLAVNLSDVAAMSATPLYAVIALALNKHWTPADVDAFYTGLKSCSDTYQCPVIGGDTSASNEASFISVTVLGKAPKEKIKLRSQAKANDAIYVTGALGKAKTGFEVLSKKCSVEAYQESVAHFLKPVPRLHEIQLIHSAFEITSLIDISDGLSSDLLHICEQSLAGCEVFADHLPFHSEAVMWCKANQEDPVEFLLQSGEEYELLFTLPADDRTAFERFCEEKQLVCQYIGRLLPRDSGCNLIRNQKNKETLKPEGWQHF